MLEAIIGQIYLMVLVARLAEINISQIIEKENSLAVKEQMRGEINLRLTDCVYSIPLTKLKFRINFKQPLANNKNTCYIVKNVINVDFQSSEIN
jgi:hypothetical protein